MQAADRLDALSPASRCWTTSGQTPTSQDLLVRMRATLNLPDALHRCGETTRGPGEPDPHQREAALPYTERRPDPAAGAAPAFSPVRLPLPRASCEGDVLYPYP